MSADLLRLVRAEQWWGYKLAPILAIFYATLWRDAVPIVSVIVDGGLLLLGLAAGAAWVSLSNDVADRSDDRIAGKLNRMSGCSTVTIAALLALPMAVGVWVAWQWRDDVPLLLAYGGAWIAFALYSLPPFRLKARGLAGVVADAAGSQALPSLVAALAAFRAVERAPDPVWCALVLIWAGAYGVRGIVWHQLYDRAADAASATGTFVQRYGVRVPRAIVRWIVFPVELMALLALLWLLPGWANLYALVLYALCTIARIERLGMRAVLSDPVERYLLVLADFYVAFWPVALLAASIVAHPKDLPIFGLHLLLFSRSIGREVGEVARALLRPMR